MTQSIIKAFLPLRRYLLVIAVLWIVYVVLSLFAPATQAINQYRINLTQINLLRVSILIPILVIWLAAFFAFIRFRYYTVQIANSAEAEGFKKIAKGFGMLLLVVMIPGYVGLIANYYPGVDMAEKVVTIIRTYIGIIFYLLAFWYFVQGSKQLVRTLKLEGQKARLPYRLVIPFMVVLCLAYAWAIFHNEFRTVSSDPTIKPTYFLPDWLITSTIFIPYLLIWLWGCRTVVNMRTYAKLVPGVIYRKTFSAIANGLTFIIILLIITQFLSQSSSVFGNASLKVVLAILYVLILAIAAGYVFLARGARELSKIEEV